MKSQHVGSSFDSLLEEDGILEEAEAQALKRVLAHQIEEAMKAQGLTKVQMAARMQTSRAHRDRLLNPRNTSVTLHTMQGAALKLGKRLRLELV